MANEHITTQCNGCGDVDEFDHSDILINFNIGQTVNLSACPQCNGDEFTIINNEE